ncbi:hypothetical protein HYC85_009906, partial [Camellia sinensis]
SSNNRSCNTGTEPSQAKPAFWTPILEKIALSNDMKEICSELKEEIAKLCAERHDHQNAIQRQKMKMSSKSYDQWIDRVKKTEEEQKKLLEDNNGLGSILVDKPPEPVIKLLAPNIENISTLEKLLKDTLHSLENDEGEGIAISGTGKTAIMNELEQS